MRPPFKYFLLKLLLLLAFLGTKGQAYYFKHYQVDDGLAHNTVVTVMQDSKGLMWIGTKGGLNRFDGYTFKSYKNEQNKFGTIGNNIIVSICEDHNGMIWVGTGKGLFKYNPYREVFTEVPVHPLYGISHITVDKSNNLWFLDNGELQYYNQTTNQITKPGLYASCLFLAPDMTLWLGHNNGSITKYNPYTKATGTIQVIDSSVPENSRQISKIFPADGNELLIGTTKQGLKSYNTVTGQKKSLLLLNSDNTEIYVRDIIRSGNNEYWIATETGIYVYNLTNHTAKNLKKRAGDNYSITDNAVYTLCKDTRGGLWAGTFFGGLNYFSEENARFEKYTPLLGINSISGTAVREICADNKDNIWIGTEDAGINKLDRQSGKFTNYTSDGKPGSVAYPNIHGLLAVGNKLYTGPFLHGLEIMDLATGRVTDHFKLVGEPGHMIADFVMCIYLTRDSTLLIGTTGTGAGLYAYNPKTKTFKHEEGIPKDSYVYALTEDHAGTIWTGSLEKGAFFVNPRTGQKGNIRFGEPTKDKASNDYLIQGIYEDSNHALWFATEGGGIIKLNADRKTFKKFTTLNGLPSNNLFRMLEDSTGHLWISSLKGLICMDLKTEKFKVYTQSNGLITDQFNYNSAFKDRFGKMYFGTVKGMIAFKPEGFTKTELSPPTYITGFQINNKELMPNEPSSPLKKSIIYTDSIVLTHDQSNFNIEFAALNYSAAKVIRYRYLMKGLDKDWTYLNSNRRAYFTDLSPGSYTFIVKAESNIGSWTGKERRLYIKILPPVWKSLAAYIIYLLALGMALYLSIRYYHRYLEKKNLNKLQRFEHEKEKEIYQAKIEFFTNIAHEIQTPLTLIIGPLERVMKKIDELPAVKKSLLMIEKNANRLLELTSQLLDFRKTEMDQFGLNFVNTDINGILKEQVAIYKQIADKDHISLQLELTRNQVIAFVDQEAFVKICTNLISNAVKYAATKATVSITNFSSTDNQFTIRFSNDGRQIPAELREKIFEPFFRISESEKPGTGIGLPLAKSLTELHNGSLKLISQDTNLNVFDLTLPVHQKFEFELSTWKNI